MEMTETTYRASTTADNLVEGQCLWNAIGAAGRGNDGLLLAAFLGVNRAARRIDIRRTAVTQRKDHVEDTQTRGSGCSTCDSGVTQNEL